MLDWMNGFGTMVKAVILAAIVVSVIVITLISIALFKPTLKQKYYKYYYAFTGGFLVVIGGLGLLHESRERVHDEYGPNIAGLGVLWTLLIVFGSGIIAAGIIYLVKKAVNPSLNKEKKNKIISHKWTAIILVLMHRIPASLAIGFLAKDAAKEWALLLVIIIHIIPEALLVYYRQRDMGYSRTKSFLVSLAVKLIFFPMIIIGAAIETGVESVWWIQPCIFAIAGFLMVYAAIIELIPEFINYTTPHHHDYHNHHEQIDDASVLGDHQHTIIGVRKERKKVMLWLSGWLLFGFISAFSILMLHV